MSNKKSMKKENKVKKGILFTFIGFVVLIIIMAIYNGLTSFVEHVLFPAWNGETIVFMIVNSVFDVWLIIVIAGIAVLAFTWIIASDSVIEAIKSRQK
jgi:uncharacterized membrane protein